MAGPEHLLVRSASALCALEVSKVREVIRPLPLAELPRMPEFVLGAISHRGEAFPVVDLGRLLGLGTSQALPTARVVVLQLPRGRLGVLVEKVEGVRENPDARVIDLVALLGEAMPASGKA